MLTFLKICFISFSFIKYKCDLYFSPDMTAIDIEEYPIHTLTTVLKYFFRELPEPLLTFELYDDFLRTAGTVYSNQMQ